MRVFSGNPSPYRFRFAFIFVDPSGIETRGRIQNTTGLQVLIHEYLVAIKLRAYHQLGLIDIQYVGVNTCMMYLQRIDQGFLRFKVPQRYRCFGFEKNSLKDF